ncbi:MAG: AMIN domain-containing protein [Synechococcales cyanobacterium RM1_1_8]|nr:AMIN domain-containing protein [Synechococcales cyanobacterium RM1_1_8]
MLFIARAKLQSPMDASSPISSTSLNGRAACCAIAPQPSPAPTARTGTSSQTRPLHQLLLRRLASPLLGLLLLGSGLPGRAPSQPAQAAALASWQYSPQTGALALDLDPGEQPRYFLMANPMRIVVDLSGDYRQAKALETQAGGVVQQIQVAQSPGGQTRLVLTLAAGTVLQPKQVDLVALGDGRWSLQPLLAAENQSVSMAAPIAPPVISLEAPPAQPLAPAPVPPLPEVDAQPDLPASLPGKEFTSMEETLARQQAAAGGQAAIAPDPAAVPDPAVSPEPDSAIPWGSDPLPPLPSTVIPQPSPASTEASVAPDLPKLPQPPARPSSPQQQQPGPGPDLGRSRPNGGRADRTPHRPGGGGDRPQTPAPQRSPAIRCQLGRRPGGSCASGDRPSASLGDNPQPNRPSQTAPSQTAPSQTAAAPNPESSTEAWSIPVEPSPGELAPEGEAAVPFLVEFGAPVPNVPL